MQGVKNEKGVWITPAFPKLIYVLDEDNITEDSKYWYLTELAAKCTAKRMVPDYISAKIMKELKKGEVYPCMGCRSFLTVEDSQMLPNGKHKFYGRFNQGVVTINLVDVACSAEGDMDRFWQILDERLELCHRALRCRHERLLGTISDVAPILWQYGALARLKKGETIDKLVLDCLNSAFYLFSQTAVCQFVNDCLIQTLPTCFTFRDNNITDFLTTDIHKWCKMCQCKRLSSILITCDLCYNLSRHITRCKEAVWFFDHCLTDDGSVLKHIFQIDQITVVLFLCKII